MFGISVKGQDQWKKQEEEEQDWHDQDLKYMMSSILNIWCYIVLLFFVIWWNIMLFWGCDNICWKHEELASGKPLHATKYGGQTSDWLVGIW